MAPSALRTPTHPRRRLRSDPDGLADEACFALDYGGVRTARRLARRALRRDPVHWVALVVLARAKRYTSPRRALPRLESVYRRLHDAAGQAEQALVADVAYDLADLHGSLSLQASDAERRELHAEAALTYWRVATQENPDLIAMVDRVPGLMHLQCAARAVVSEAAVDSWVVT